MAFQNIAGRLVDVIFGYDFFVSYTWADGSKYAHSVYEKLKAQGFTHIFYSPTLFLFAAEMGVEGTGGMSLIAQGEGVKKSPEYPLLRNWSTFTLYKQKFLEPVYSDKNGYEILRIK